MVQPCVSLDVNDVLAQSERAALETMQVGSDVPVPAGLYQQRRGPVLMDPPP